MVQAGRVVKASDVAVQACRLTRTAAQTIADETLTLVAFTSEEFDTDGMHDTATLNTRITIQTAGIYIIGFNGVIGSGSGYIRTMCVLRLNGVMEIARKSTPGTSTAVQQDLNVTTVYQFDVGDYIEVQVYHDNGTGSSQPLEVTPDRSPEFWAARIGS